MSAISFSGGGCGFASKAPTSCSGMRSRTTSMRRRPRVADSSTSRIFFFSLAFIGRDADGILHVLLLQRLVDLWLGEGCIGAKHYFLTQFLLALDFRQKHFLPVLGTMYVAGPQLRSQTVSLPVEQQQRVIAGRLEVTVVGTLLLLPVYRN